MTSQDRAGRALVALLLVALTALGCAALTERPATAKLVVQYATLKYVGDDVEKAARVVAVADSVELAATSGEVGSLDALEALIPLADLDPADRLLATQLVSVIREELEQRLDLGSASELAEHVGTLASWVREAAAISALPPPLE